MVGAVAADCNEDKVPEECEETRGKTGGGGEQTLLRGLPSRATEGGDNDADGRALLVLAKKETEDGAVVVNAKVTISQSTMTMMKR